MGHVEQSRLNIARTVLPTSCEGGTEQQPLPSTKIVGTVWNSKQNGKIYDPAGIAPCITAGPHGGAVPCIIEYEKN